MERVLSHPAARPLASRFGRDELKRAARNAMEEGAGASIAALLGRCAEILECRFEPGLPRVINATGVLIHTNLGRAPLSDGALLAIESQCRGYQALEFDLNTGRRGGRGRKLSDHLARFLGAQDALVVNNNAAAVLLALCAAAAGRDVLVSRGELVAIGGSFKIPEILEASGARLLEVGTTNRTKIDDFERKFRPSVGAVLTVHPSNYEIRGYVKRPELAEISSFARRRRVPWIHDQGSGNLVDLDVFGIPGEEKVSDVLALGASLVAFSGDKLFGGPQAGILAGKRAAVERAAKHPLARAVRAGKLTLSALEATLFDWIMRGPASIPLYALAAVSAGELTRRAQIIAAALPPQYCAHAVATRSLFGGGTTPEKSFASAAVQLSPGRDSKAAERLASQLRMCNPPVVGRIEAGHVLLDLRAVRADEDALIVEALQHLGPAPSR